MEGGSTSHSPQHQLHTWGAKASSKTSFSSPTALLGVFSEQLQYLPHWMWGHFSTVSVKRLEDKIVVRSFSSWPIMSTVFLLFSSLWGWCLISGFKSCSYLCSSQVIFFSCNDFISESLRQHSKFSPFVLMCIYTSTYIIWKFTVECLFWKDFHHPHKVTAYEALMPLKHFL